MEASNSPARSVAEARYRRLFEQKLVGVFRSEAAADGRIIQCNEKFAELFGYDSPADVIGTPGEAFYPDDEDRQERVDRVRRGDEDLKDVARLRRRDGSMMWGIAHVHLAEDPEHGEVLEGMIFDVTARIRAREELERTKEKFETVFEVSPVAIAIADVDGGRFVEANAAFADLFGHEMDELSNGGVSPPDVWADPDERRSVVRDLRDGEPVRDREVRFRRKSGTVWHALFSATLATMADRTYLVAGAQDISEQKRAREALERAEQKFRGVFQISPVALKVVDPETGTILEANATFGDVFGYGRDRILEGELSSEDLWTSPEQWSRIRQRLREGGEVRDEEIQMRRRDGTVFDALYSGAVLRLDDGPLLVCAVQDVSHLKEVERELEHRSLHDRLTGLPNRALFWDRLEHALERSQRTGEELAVLFLDLDGFKRINDEHGHAAGDEVLRRVADRLRSGVRDADTLARLGGDEFGVLLENLEDGPDAVKAARRLTDRFEPAVPVAGEEALVHLSCGIALAEGDRGGEATLTADELVHRADRAMYVAKEEPGSSSHLCGPELAAGEPTGRLRREIELKGALEAGEVVPYYQPIVDLEDGRIVGAEALARWEHPERGLVAPGEFIPLAEETGLIVQLGQLVVRTACGQLAEWRQGGLPPAGFRLHVNLSARELERPDVVERLEGLFRALGLEPECVEFEATESVAIESAHVLDRIRRLGSPVAVDDFGTRYATLERLTTLELDSLKLDQSFVNGIGESGRHEAVVDASLTLAESLDLRPVAEGVETDRQREGLLQRGCRYGQGFLFAGAVPAEELAEWLEEGRRLPVPS